MERRKVQKIGYSTFSVSLPKEWVIQNGIKGGDVVYLFRENNGTMRVLTEDLLKEEARPKDFSINLEMINSPRLLERLIVGCYNMGAETIKISSSSRIESNRMEEVRAIVSRIIGLSILEETKNEIILNCSIDLSKFEVFTLLRRLSSIASTMFDESVEALLKGDEVLASDVEKRELEANAIYRLITRLLFSAQNSPILAEKMGLNTPVDIPIGWSASRELERVADCANSIAMIAKNYSQIHEKTPKEELEKISHLSKMAGDVFQKAVNSIFSEDVLDANTAINTRYDLETEVSNYMREDSNIPHFRTAAMIFDIVAENSSNLAQLQIFREAKKFKASNSASKTEMK